MLRLLDMRGVVGCDYSVCSRICHVVASDVSWDNFSGVKVIVEVVDTADVLCVCFSMYVRVMLTWTYTHTNRLWSTLLYWSACLSFCFIRRIMG